MMYYYVIDGEVYFTLCRGTYPTKLSPVWNSPSASAWLIPGTMGNSDDEG
jgi:hypothetical protein